MNNQSWALSYVDLFNIAMSIKQLYFADTILRGGIDYVPSAKLFQDVEITVDFKGSTLVLGPLELTASAKPKSIKFLDEEAYCYCLNTLADKAGFFDKSSSNSVHKKYSMFMISSHKSIKEIYTDQVITPFVRNIATQPWFITTNKFKVSFKPLIDEFVIDPRVCLNYKDCLGQYTGPLLEVPNIGYDRLDSYTCSMLGRKRIAGQNSKVPICVNRIKCELSTCT